MSFSTHVLPRDLAPARGRLWADGLGDPGSCWEPASKDPFPYSIVSSGGWAPLLQAPALPSPHDPAMPQHQLPQGS